MYNRNGRGGYQQQGFQGYQQRGYPGYGYPAQGYGGQGYGAPPRQPPRRKRDKSQRDTKTADAIPPSKHVTFDSKHRTQQKHRSTSEDSHDAKVCGPRQIFLRLRKNEQDRVTYEIIYSNLVCKEIQRTGDIVSIQLDKVPVSVRSSQQGIDVRLEGTTINLKLQPTSTDESVAVIVEH